MAHRTLERIRSHNYLSLWMNPGPLEVTDHALLEKRRWCCATLVAFSVALIVNISVGTTLVVWLNRATSERASMFSLDVFVKEEVARKVSDNILVWEQQQRIAKFDNGTIDALHVYLHRPQYNGQDGPSDVTGWIKTRENNDIEGIAIVNARSFKIKKHGIYQVYSHLSFLGVGDNAPSFKQLIMRDPDTILLENEESKSCDLVNGYREPCHTSVIFAALQLQQGDSIYVRANPSRNLVYESNSSFFGIVKLE